MTDHFSEDAYNSDLDQTGYDDGMSHDGTGFDDQSVNDQLWSVEQGMDDLSPNLPDDMPASDISYDSVPDAPELPTYDDPSYDPAATEDQAALDPMGNPIDPAPAGTQDFGADPAAGTSADPWVQDQIDAANQGYPEADAGTGATPDPWVQDQIDAANDPYGAQAPDTLDADVNDGTEEWNPQGGGSEFDPSTGHYVDPVTGDEYNANGELLDPTTGQPYIDPLDVPQGGDMPAYDPNDPNVGLDPSDPNYDHYYAENGHPYDGPSDVADGTGYDYQPVEYDYSDPFGQDGYDPGYDPYQEPGYNPYDDNVYGDSYDVQYDPCYGDSHYDSYQNVYVDNSTHIDVHQDVYASASDNTVIENNDGYAPSDVDYTPDTNYDTTYTGWDQSYDAPYQSYDAMEVAHYAPTFDVTDFDGAGTPLSDGAFFHEVENPAHGPISVEASIVEKITGEPYNETSAVQEAENAGIYDPEAGMYNTQVGSYLELHGIETETVYGADMNTLMDALEHGDQVIAVVDTNETADPLRDVATGEPIEQNPPALNSVWVTGIDVDENGHAFVIVNDPTWPEGQTQAIAVEDFANAWADGDNQAVIAHTGEPTGR
ncbi:MAG: hypothetical protein HOU01_11505 [Streptomycetaceae bacterium]|nr:hypothetical protein [Streptomycetaceae bacterium]